MNNYIKSRTITVLIFILMFGISGSWSQLYGQIVEPPVREVDDPRTPLEEGFNNRIGGSIFVNNFGYGISGIYSHALGAYSELYFTTGITGIRDVTEQNFQDFFTGQRVVPDKYNRAIGFPFMAGIKKRIFPRQIADNFRFFVAAAGGPAMAFVYPYINDSNESGFRDFVITPIGFQAIEEKNDFFSGWGDGSTEWGAAGEIKVGVDLGSNFKRQSTLEIGFFFYYFDQGLQIMEPNQPFGFEPCPGQPNLGCPIAEVDGERKSFFDAQKFFGTPQIKFTFSGWW